VAICVGVPVVFLIAFLVLLRQHNKWRRGILVEEIIYFILAYSLAILFVFVVSEFIKRLFGRLRPDYLARCFGSNDINDWAALGYDVLAEIPEVPDCSHSKLSKSELDDGRMSFPSEHSGLTWSVFTFTAFWVYGKLCLFHNTGAFRLALPFGILLIPTAISISRTSDYRHHPSDVLAGTFIGIFIAWLVYCFYWPLSMKPLAADSYCIYEGTVNGRNTKLREVTAARFRVSDPELFLSPEYQARRKDFFRGRVFVDRNENQGFFAIPAAGLDDRLQIDDCCESTENLSPGNNAGFDEIKSTK